MTEGQREKYRILASDVKNGKISMNQSFLEAKKDFSNFQGEKEEGFKGNIGDWITTAQDSGWIDVATKEQPIIIPPKPKSRTKIVGTVSVVVGILAVYLLVNEIRKAQKQ